MPIFSNKLLEPWFAPPVNANALEAQLEREVPPGHVLFGRRMQAVARRQDCDDVLFVSIDVTPTIVAVVHLTWSKRGESSDLPSAQLYSSIAEWLEQGMRQNHDAYAGG